ncbi:MAG: glycosyltransferase [Crocinitomicaceae bacterium]|nr:glycosyltransferase [Crocinitomicaceae bacterium]
MNPFFSVIIPVYNREKRLPEVLNSLVNQGFKDFETIIVDDCSTDSSFEVAKEHQLANKVVFRNPANSERCITRNNGIEKAKGKYICFLDSDDLFLENHLKVLHQYLSEQNNPEIMAFTNSFLENEAGDKTEKIVPSFVQNDKFAYLLHYTPNPARVCVAKSILDRLRFDPDIPGLEDLDLWLRIAVKYPIVHIEKYTNVYYIHSEMYTIADTQRYKNELQFFKKIFDKPELSASLPRSSRNRLISMCHFHLSQQENEAGHSWNAIQHAFTSYRKFPKGYNGKTNKIVFVTIVYNLPIIGWIIKRIKS